MKRTIYEAKKQSCMFRMLVPIGWMILIRNAKIAIIRIRMTDLEKDGLNCFLSGLGAGLRWIQSH